jgi:hypothetical protein
MNAIVYPAPVANCRTSPARGVMRSVGRASDGALGLRLLVRQEKEALYYIILSVCLCVSLVIQHARHMRRIVLSSVACPPLPSLQITT